MTSSAHPEVILFPDVEDLLVTYLTAELPGLGDAATVHVRVPSPRPDRFVLVPRVGGPRQNLVVDNPTIAVECWAATDAQALQLCQRVRGLIHALPGRTVVGRRFYRTGEFAGPANLPDPASAQSRYILNVSIRVRGTAA